MPVGSPTVCVTGGWGEKSSETEHCQSHEKGWKPRRVPVVPCTLCWATITEYKMRLQLEECTPILTWLLAPPDLFLPLQKTSFTSIAFTGSRAFRKIESGWISPCHLCQTNRGARWMQLYKATTTEERSWLPHPTRLLAEFSKETCLLWRLWRQIEKLWSWHSWQRQWSTG